MKDIHKLQPDDDLMSEKTGAGKSKISSQTPVKFRALAHTYDMKAFQDQLLRWCIVDHIPFAQVDKPEFRKLLKIATPVLSDVPVSATSLRRWAKAAHQVEKEKMKDTLRKAYSKFHISFDGWSGMLFSQLSHTSWARERTQVITTNLCFLH